MRIDLDKIPADFLVKIGRPMHGSIRARYPENGVGHDATFPDLGFEQEAVLVQPPHIATKWTSENKIFRSSMWTLGGRLISAGFPKFTNWGEQPEFEPLDITGDLTYMEKLDGSLLIVSIYQGKPIIRTRGTFDARCLENGHEIDFLMQKYPKAFDIPNLSTLGTYLYEWETPTNRIVLNRFEEPTLSLVGFIWHEDYSYMQQWQLDNLAESLEVPRPKVIHLNGLDHAEDWAKEFEGGEGVVVYSEDGQNCKKVKTDWYKARHHLKDAIDSNKALVRTFLSSGAHTEQEFFAHIEKILDFETATYALPRIKEVAKLYINFIETTAEINAYVDNLANMEYSRKEAAIDIQDRFRPRWQQQIAFASLSGKPLKTEFLEKFLIDQMDKLS